MEVQIAQASDGAGLPLDGMGHAYTYNADGTLATETVVQSGRTYVKTYTWTNGLLTNESAWIKQ